MDIMLVLGAGIGAACVGIIVLGARSFGRNGVTESATAAPAPNPAKPEVNGAPDQTRAEEPVKLVTDALHNLVILLSCNVEDMLGNASAYNEKLEGHRSNINEKMSPSEIRDLAGVLVREIEAIQASNENYRTELRQANTRLVEQEAKLDKLQAEASIDFLTKLPNRRALDARLDDEIYRAQRYKQKLSVAFIDIDHFKKLNDTHGHQVGDRILRGFALELSASIRQSDFVARYGGEEFALLLPSTSINMARVLVEKVRKRIETAVFRYEKQEIRLTISAGLGELNPELDSKDGLLKRVDSAMYRAKAAGRNRIVEAEPPS